MSDGDGEGDGGGALEDDDLVLEDTTLDSQFLSLFANGPAVLASLAAAGASARGIEEDDDDGDGDGDR